jgi:hypothetical protein
MSVERTVFNKNLPATFAGRLHDPRTELPWGIDNFETPPQEGHPRRLRRDHARIEKFRRERPKNIGELDLTSSR